MSVAARCADMLTQGQTRWSIPLPSLVPTSPLVTALARSCLAGELTVEQVRDRCYETLGRHWRWVAGMARRYVAAFSGRTRPRLRDVVLFLRQDDGFARAWVEHSHELRVIRWIPEPQRMQPVVAATGWEIPAIDGVGELAAWLGVDVGELEWFADLKGLGRKRCDPRLRHYFYRAVAKDSGGVRLIEAPKVRLKELQRRLLSQILDRIPAHAAVHGFVRGRSIKTFAAPHVGRAVLLRMDLKDFFPSFPAARIEALFRTAGYPEAVANLLAGICTNAAPRDVWSRLACDVDLATMREARELYSRPHLPQGAPTSPALANLCSYRMDCRLSGLATAVGAEYTRYADDLAFSGGEGLARRAEGFTAQVAAIVAEEGFAVHHRKTRRMRQDARQYIAGVVVNQRVNVVRKDFDRLKAILTNCVRRGAASENREGHPLFAAHLDGRVGFVEMINPAKGARLRRIFEQIRWEG